MTPYLTGVSSEAHGARYVLPWLPVIDRPENSGYVGGAVVLSGQNRKRENHESMADNQKLIIVHVEFSMFPEVCV